MSVTKACSVITSRSSRLHLFPPASRMATSTFLHHLIDGIATCPFLLFFSLEKYIKYKCDHDGVRGNMLRQRLIIHHGTTRRGRWSDRCRSRRRKEDATSLLPWIDNIQVLPLFLKKKKENWMAVARILTFPIAWLESIQDRPRVSDVRVMPRPWIRQPVWFAP